MVMKTEKEKKRKKDALNKLTVGGYRKQTNEKWMP